MAHFSFLNDSSGIPDILGHDLTLYGSIPELREKIMRGPSPLSAAERELIAAFVSRLNECTLCVDRHELLAAQLGSDVTVLQSLVASVDEAPISDRLRPIFRFVKKLTEQPARIVKSDAEAVFAAGWNEQALEHAIAVCALLNMVNRLADGYGLKGGQDE
jgi:uncharacterized peroxidase-related enzyme